MSMDKTIANLKLIKDKTSDFKLELGRVKDEFTNAISTLQAEHVQQATESGDKYSINLYSDIDRAIKFFTKTEDFSFAIEKVNQLMKNLGLDLNLQVNLSNNFDIANFMNIFIPEYGLSRFYKNTKDQILLDFDNIFNSDEAKAAMEKPAPIPAQPLPISSREISIFDQEEVVEEESEEADTQAESESTQTDLQNVSDMSKEDQLAFQQGVDNAVKIPESELISPDARYDGDYFIRSFYLKINVKNRSSRVKLFAPVTPDGKWLATKNGNLIISKFEITAENNFLNFAAKAVDQKPEGFISWTQIGGVPKRGVLPTLPKIGQAGSSKSDGIDGDSTEASLSQAVIAHSLNYSSHFFIREEVPLIRKFNSAEEKLKRELKEDLNLFAILSSIYPDFSRLSNQDMIMYIDETSLPHKLVIDNDVSAKFNNFVFSKISEIKNSLQSALTSAAKSEKREIAEQSRFDNSKKIDDLLSACKIRDRIIYSKFLSLKNDLSARSIESFDAKSLDRLNVEDILVTNLLKNSNTNLGNGLLGLTQILCFTSSIYVNSFAANMVAGKTGVIKEDFFLDGELIEAAFNQFSDSFRSQLTSKINLFFGSSIVDATGGLYCRYISSSIQLSGLYINAYNFAARPVRLGWNYISCPTCKKDIYYSKYKDAPAYMGAELVPLIAGGMEISEQKAQAFLDPKELSDYEEERYSFFRKNGQLITTQELRAASQQMGKNWDEILKMISSNNPSEHNLGIQERQVLLKSMDAREIKRKRGLGSAAVFSYKTKCPFSGGQLPESIVFAESRKKQGLGISDFSCGLSLNVDELLSTERAMEPYEMHSAPHDPTVDPELKLNEAINESIKRGVITEDDRSRFIDELRKRRSGGWKFSNTMFRCPCKPNTELEDKNSSIKDAKYKYLASPISGFFTKELLESGIIHPPTTESGGLHEMEDYTSTYLVCGDLTSISSFCRDTTDENSLYGILKTKIKEALAESNVQSQAYISNFIDTLLQLGVDFNDILPFIDKVYSDQFKTAISSSHKNILNSIIKTAAEGMDMGLSSHDIESRMSRSSIIGDLKLVCSNGHRFRIIDSIKFGQTHVGHTITKKSMLGSTLYQQVKNISTKNGIENLHASLGSQIPGSKSGQTVLSRIAKGNLSSNMKNFTEWDGVWDSKKGLSEYYYVDRDGNYYVFNSLPRTVIWGEANKEYSVMPFTQRDKNTNLLVSANPLKIDDKAADDTEKEGGSGPTLADKKQAKEFTDAVEDASEYDKLPIETTANERAMLDVYYSPLAVVLQGALVSIRDFCNRATSIHLMASLHGTPSSFKNEDKVTPIVKDVIARFYVLESKKAGEDEETIRESLPSIVDNAFAYFDKNYLEQLRVQDLRFLNILEPSISPIEKPTISRIILLSVTAAVGKSIGELSDISSKIFDSNFRKEMESDLFSADLGQKIDEIVRLIKSNIEGPKSSAVKELMGGSEKMMVSKLQGSEYIGRVMMMSSALFLSESISRLYRKYLQKTSSKYIGIDIGLDFSSPEKIVKVNPNINDGSIFGISDAEINSIPTSFPFASLFENLSEDELDDLNIDEEEIEDYQDIARYESEVINQINIYSQKLQNLDKKIKDLNDVVPKPVSVLNGLMDERKRTDRAIKNLNSTRRAITEIATEFLREHGSLFVEFIGEIKEEIMKIQMACTNYKYTEKAVAIMRESLVKKIEVDQSMDNASKKITSTIIDRCITNVPITTISLAGGDKYHAYYAGGSSIGAGGPFRMLPLFNADVVIIPGLPAYAPPVFALSNSNNNYAGLGIQITQAPPPKKVIVLYKDIEGDFIQPYPTSLPEEVALSGWKTGIIDASKNIKLKSEREISLFYHPYTLGVLEDGARVKPSFSEKIVGFTNKHLNYNSMVGFNFGPQSTRSGVVALFPTPYAHGDKLNNGGTHVGLLLPLRYSKSEEGVKQGTVKIAPFFDAKIPIELPTDSPGDTIKINISDFLVRDPPDLAQQILTQISQRYIQYEQDAERVSNTLAKKKLREDCKKDIAELFDRYRHLPYKVTNTASSSSVQYEGKVSGADPSVASVAKASTTPYIPMADFITCNRILNLKEFSPEFGGHNFWMDGDTEAAPTVKGAIEQMLIDINSLDELADIMNKKLNDNEIRITARDLLDPHHGVFDKIYLKVKKDAGGRKTDEEIVKIAIDKIREVTTYNIEDDYNPLSSATTADSRKRLLNDYRLDTFWAKKMDKRPTKTAEAIGLGRWTTAVGRFYPITEGSSRDDDQPGARIKVMSEIFPFNNEDGSGRTETFRRIQDPNSNAIISPDDFNYASFLYGSRHTVESAYYPGGSPEESRKFLQEVKAHEDRSMTVSAVKYAAAISDFFTTNIVMNLRQRILLEKEGRDIEEDAKSIRSISKKASVLKPTVKRVRVAPLESVDNIRMAGMISLLSMFTK